MDALTRIILESMLASRLNTIGSTMQSGAAAPTITTTRKAANSVPITSNLELKSCKSAWPASVRCKYRFAPSCRKLSASTA